MPRRQFGPSFLNNDGLSFLPFILIASINNHFSVRVEFLPARRWIRSSNAQAIANPIGTSVVEAQAESDA